MLERRRLLFLAILVAGGCSEPYASVGNDAGTPAGSGGGGGASAGTGGSGGASSTTSTTATTTVGSGGSGGSGGGAGGFLEGPGVSGTLRNEAGQPVNAAVLACTSATCLFGHSDANGRFLVAMDASGNVAVKTQEDESTTPRSAAALVPVQLDGTQPVELGIVLVPSLPAGVPVGALNSEPKTYMMGDGLELTARPADLEAELGHALIDVAARAIPAAYIHPIAALGDEQILALYALHPFAGTSASPMGFRAPSDLPAGTVVKFRSISWLDGTLSAPALGKADGDFVATNAGEGLKDLTYLVISK